MMTPYGWPHCPPPVQQQLRQFTGKIEALLATNLVGIYLHGSLALGSFNPERSDLDLLVVTHQPMAVETKRQLAKHLLHFSRQPQPIEISFLSKGDLLPWQHPAPFDLHYSEMWRQAYERDLATEVWKSWNEERRYDPDLAAHITVTTHRGLCLSGAAIAEVFPNVPPQDYIASIMGDVLDGLDRIAHDPVYAILNACRTWAYLRHGQIYSKEEGGVWALPHLPEPLRPPVLGALALYRGEPEAGPIAEELLEPFATYMRHTLAQLGPE